jgi:hypothetical protein
MREMGSLSGVPIEPPEQTELLDACVAVAGVIGGGVPGGERLSTPLAPFFRMDLMEEFWQLEGMTRSGCSFSSRTR